MKRCSKRHFRRLVVAVCSLLIMLLAVIIWSVDWSPWLCNRVVPWLGANRQPRLAHICLVLAGWNNHPEAMYQLGLEAERNDPEAAIEWYQGAADLLHQPSQVALAQVLEKQGRQDVELRRILAENGHPGSQLVLAQHLIACGKRNEGMLWMRTAALNGNTQAAVEFGDLLVNDPRGVRTALHWYEYAAHCGDPVGVERLIDVWLANADQSPDLSLKFSFIRKELERRNDVKSICGFGVLHEFGLAGCRKDPKEAAKLYYRAASEKSEPGAILFGKILAARETDAYWGKGFVSAIRQRAESGCTSSLFMLGRLHEVGLGVEKDLKEARRCYRAALSGKSPSPQAAYYLGMMYFSGQGVPKSEPEAYALFKEGDRLGHAGSTQMIGRFLLEGLGNVKADPAQGISCLKTAIAAGNHNACILLAKHYCSVHVQRFHRGESCTNYTDAKSTRKRVRSLLERPAREGCAEAMYRLGSPWELRRSKDRAWIKAQ